MSANKPIISFKASPEILAWIQAKKAEGYNVSLLLRRAVEAWMASEGASRTPQPCGGGVIEAQWGADEAQELLGIDDDDDEGEN